MNEKQTEKFDSLREGAGRLTAMTEGRILEAQEALADGKFALALTRLQEAQAKLTPVVRALGWMDFEPGTHIIRASQLQEGMVLTGYGTIEDVSVTTEDHGHESECVNVTAQVDNKPVAFNGDQEVVIRVGE